MGILIFVTSLLRNGALFYLQVCYLAMLTTAKIIYRDKGKGKAHPRTGHEGPEGE